MKRFKLEVLFDNQYVKYSIISGLAFLNSFAFAYAKSLGDVESTYIGSRFWGYNPTSLLYFAACWFLLYRTINEKTWKDKGRLILSTFLGIFMSMTFIWGNMMFNGTAHIFDSVSKAIVSIIGIIGLSIFYIPLFSEICGVFNSLSERFSKADDSTQKIVSNKHLVLFFLITWIIFFASYVPLLLYWYPGNFVFDAGDQVYDYMSGNMSTHHTIAHTMLLGKLYEFGYKRGDVNIGILLYSLLQMSVLSFSIAFFLTECRKRIKVKAFRVILYVLFIANTSLPFFAISTVKGVYTAAFTLIAITLLWKITKCEKWRTKIALTACFIISLIIASLFRNNVIYAYVVAGIIIVIIQKGWRQRVLFALAFLLIIGGNKVYTKVAMEKWQIKEVDKERESQSVPLMFLARVEVNHGDVLSKKEWEEILLYISDVRETGYSPFISDEVKGLASENMIKNNKLNYYKLIVKLAIKYPGDLIESVAGLTLAYWYPDDYPYYMLGASSLHNKIIGRGYLEIELKNYLPFGSKMMEAFYYKGYGRLETPILGWFWRTTTYTWIFFFGFFYLIYRKKWKQLSFVSIPFMYLLTCFLGPVAWMRYIVINIVTLPVMIWCMLDSNEVAEK